MALITDPDDLSQGALTNVADLAFTASAGVATTITGTATLPTLADDEFFEVRSANLPGNDGLYRVNDGSPTTSSVTADKITGPNPVNDSSSSTDILGNSTVTANEKSVMFDTTDKRVYLLEQGNLSVDGVTEQALYSFGKKRWKDDDELIKFDFPMVAITPEQFEFEKDWNPEDNGGESIRTRKLIRTGGWSEIDSASILQRQYSGVITLGTFEDSVTDTAYYQLGADPTDTGATTNFDFAGPVNEAVLVYQNFGNVDTLTFAATNTITRATGSYLTDGYRVGGQVTVENADTAGNNGTFVITGVVALTLTVTGTPFTNEADTNARLSVDNRNVLNVFLRVRDGDANGKIYDNSTLSAIGVTAVDNKVFRFPLQNSTDLKIAETDANIDANTPYTQINIKYFDGIYSKDIDTGTNRDFGVVVDVGTHTGIDGSITAAGTVLTTADGNIPGGSLYDGGVLSLYEGTDENLTFTIASTTATTVTISGGTFTATESNISFSIQRATPVVATIQEIYEKVQRELRQTADINEITSATDVVVGNTADELLVFVGDTLVTQQVANPNSATSDGVNIEGFDSNDTNSIQFTDNAGASGFSFPFVAAGTISFNNNLVNDTDPEFWMFFQYTERTSVTDLVLTSGGTETLTSVGSNLPALVANDYIDINGLTGGDEAMNGVYRIEVVNTSTSDYDVVRYDGVAVVTVASTTANVDENPVDSPGAIIVDDNGGADIVGNISGSSTSFDFDYDGNTQGGRTAATDANIILKAIGLETAQDAETLGVITRNTGLAFSLVSGLERNFTP